MEPLDILSDIEDKLQVECTPLSWPIGMGKRFKGVYNLYRKELHLFTPGEKTRNQTGIVITDLSDPKLDELLGDQAEELREDISEQKKNLLGRRIFEAVAAEYASEYADEESAQSTLRETESRLSDTEKALEESERKRAVVERRVKMEEVLTPLAGRQREVMEAILKNVDTNALGEGYKTFIGRVLRESNEDANSEKEEKVLAEGEKETSKKKLEKDEAVEKTGDVETDESEGDKGNEDVKKLDEGTRARLQRLAGVKRK